MPEKIRVVIADDHPIVRTGLRLMLGMEEGIELVGKPPMEAQRFT